MQRVTLLLIVLFCISLDLYAQGGDTAGTLQGFVTDHQEHPIPDATVTAVSLSNSVNRTTKTDNAGSFVLILQPDIYNVTIEATGFTPVTTKLKILGKDKVEIRTTLKVGEIGVSLTVTDDPSTAGTAIDIAFFSNIPTSRTVQGLYTLAPTVARSGFREAGDRDREIFGGASYDMGISYDGFEINSAHGGRTNINVPFESIQTAVIAFNPFSVETDRSGSNSVNIFLNRGGNYFHGSAFLHFNNNNLQSRPPFSNSAHPSFDREYFGGSLTGPLKKDVSFFNIAIEQRRVRGITTVGERDSGRREIIRGFSRTSLDNTLISAGINITADDNNRISGLYLFESRNSLEPGFSLGGKLQTPENFQVRKYIGQQIQFNWSRELRNTFRNELGIAVYLSHERSAPVSTRPQIVYPSLNTGANFLADQSNTLNTVNIVDDVSWYPKFGVLKFGAKYYYSGVGKTSNFNIFGTGIIFVPCDFPGQTGCPGATDDANIPVTLALINKQTLINGFEGFGKRGLIPPIDNHAFAAYLQYDHKFKHNLRLFLGLRWNYETNLTGSDQINQYRPGRRRHQKNKIGSRIGISWILRRITIRGGHGFYFDRNELVTRELELLADGDRLPIARSIDTTLSNPFNLGLNPISQIFVTDNSFKSPFISMFNASGEIDLGRSMSLHAAFLSQRGKHLPRRFEVNILENGDRLNNNFGSVIETKSIAKSDYDAFSTSFRRRNNRGIGTIYATYTLARSVDHADEPLGVVNLGSDMLNPERDRGHTSYVPKHDFNFNWLLYLPFNFDVSAKVRAFSSLPFDILQNHDFSGAIRSGLFRLPGLPRNAGNREVQNGADLNAYIDAFNADPSLVSRHGGPIARVDPRIKFNAPILTIDLGLSKTFMNKDRTRRFQLKGDIFNLLNRRNIIGLSATNLSGLENNLEQPDFGGPLGVLSGGIFGDFTSRYLKISARFSF
jgi:hypothetical protein